MWELAISFSGQRSASWSLLWCLLMTLFSAGSARAQMDVYQKPSAFISETFGGEIPRARALTLTKRQQSEIKRLIGARYGSARVRYWTNGVRTAWILEHIGKTKPITTGYITAKGKIVDVKVLIYRESHGWEVRQKFFTRQFTGSTLEEDGKLTKRVDNIAGATLSTRALTKLAKLALYLDAQRPEG